MQLYIHTAGRPDRQHTLDVLNAAGLDAVLVLDVLNAAGLDAVLVLQEREVDRHFDTCAHRALFNVLPPNITSLSPTRQYIAERHYARYANGEINDPFFCLLDDDLSGFAKRRKDDPTRFETCTPDDVAILFALIRERLDTHAHVGVLAREGANRVTDDYLYCTRMMRLLAYDSRVLHRTGARFDRVPCKQDFDMTLQLLRAGYANCVIASYVQNQSGGSQTDGGCSTYRTKEMMTAACHELARLHPGFVKVVQKETKGSWGGGVRDEVQISWKKAYESACVNLLE